MGKAWKLLVITSWRLWTTYLLAITTAHASCIVYWRIYNQRRKHVLPLSKQMEIVQIPKKDKTKRLHLFMPHLHKALQIYVFLSEITDFV